MASTSTQRQKRRDIYVRRGDTYREAVTFRVKNGAAIDLTGYTFLGHIRATVESESTIAVFTIIIIDAANGEIEIVISADTTALLPTETTASGVYDLQFTTPAGDVRTFMVGNVYFESDVARP